MLKMVSLIPLFICFHLLGFTGAGQESYELLHLHDSLQPILHTGETPLAVSVSDEDLPKVSSTILMAEGWVRTHVLAFFPSAKITTIVVRASVLCKKSHEHKLGLVLPSLKNIYHSLTRWGLEKEIKVSAALSSECLNPRFHNVLKPLLEFLRSTNSAHSVIPTPTKLVPESDEIEHLVSSHLDALNNLGFHSIHKINVIVPITEEIKIKHSGRKLSFIGAAFTDPFAQFPQSPNPSPIFNFPSPPNTPENPLSPLGAAASSPATSVSFPPRLPPVTVLPARPPLVTVYPGRPPARPPYGPALPPCKPLPAPAPAKVGMEKGSWCIAKPNVPAETLQEAMDYACGPGGADCGAIKPTGSCFFPDSVVAHASYAFNGYWQRNKRQGGSCSFGGTAMVVNSDPSFLHCRFVLS